MDTDVEVVKRLDSLLKYSAFIGFESNQHISTGTIGAVSQNTWIGLLSKEYDARHFRIGNEKYDLTTNVVRITALTKQLYGIRLDGSFQIFGENMALFPFDWLCAKSYETGEVLQSDQTLTIHHFNGSWLSGEDKAYMEQVHSYQRKYPGIYRNKIGGLLIKTAAAYKTGGGADGYPKDKENIEPSQWMCKGTQSLSKKSQQSEYPVFWGHAQSCGREVV